MAESNAWRTECCNRLLVALADNARSSLVVIIKPRRRGRRFPMYTATVTDDNGKLMAACRHELAPFPTDAEKEVIERILWSALLQ